IAERACDAMKLVDIIRMSSTCSTHAIGYQRISCGPYNARKLFRLVEISGRFSDVSPLNERATVARRMTAKLFRRRWHFFLAASITVVSAANPSLLRDSRAQSRKLTLISQDTSTRAIAGDAGTPKIDALDTT